LYNIVSSGISRAELASFGREAKLRGARELQLPAEEAIFNFIKICTPAPYLLYVNLYVEDVRSSAKKIFFDCSLILLLTPHDI
jgi:hypothetical protein